MKIAKAAFTDVDKDGSGEIDSDELGKIMLKISEQMGACPPSKEELKKCLIVLILAIPEKLILMNFKFFL